MRPATLKQLRLRTAVPLKDCRTETVADTLMNFYSRLGFPEEMLSDMGTQLTPECMMEVGRLLDVKQLMTTPTIRCVAA